MFSLIFTIIISYVIGSFPTSIIVARRSGGIDIREHGSGNAGATNIARVLGMRAAVVVALIDIMKGFIPVMLVIYLQYPQDAGIPAGLFPIFAGASAVLGHIFPVFAGFRGGKGVATSAGALLALYPLVIPFCAIVFALTLFSTGIVSLSSLVTALSLPLVYLAVTALSPLRPFPPAPFYFMLFLTLLIFFTHRNNIVRMSRGEERRFEKIRLFGRRSSSKGE